MFQHAGLSYAAIVKNAFGVLKRPAPFNAPVQDTFAGVTASVFGVVGWGVCAGVVWYTFA